MRLLERLKLHRHVGIVVEPAMKRQCPLRQRLPQDLQRLDIHLLPMIGVDPEIGSLDRRNPSSDAEIEASAAELIEHADFLDHAQRMMER